jgi:hypothetical protein
VRRPVPDSKKGTALDILPPGQEDGLHASADWECPEGGAEAVLHLHLNVFSYSENVDSHCCSFVHRLSHIFVEWDSLAR